MERVWSRWSSSRGGAALSRDAMPQDGLNEPIIYQQWMLFLELEDKDPKGSVCVCNKHFTVDSFIN